MPSGFLDNIKRSVARRAARFIQYWGEDVDLTMDKRIAKYRSLGVKIGTNTALWNVSVDPIYPELITIGNNVTITHSVILTHDDSTILHTYRRKVAPTTIKDNVFIGWNSIILPGVTIGRNCIIGAGSIVSKDIPENCVAAGIPAKVIKSIPEFIAGLKSEDVLLRYEVQSNIVMDDEHNAMKKEVLQKYCGTP